MQLTNDTKRRIIPPHGNPFLNYHLTYIAQQPILYIQNQVIRLIDNLITKGLTNEFRTLGVFYVLTALTIVSQQAAQSLPWLFESTQGMYNLPN